MNKHGKGWLANNINLGRLDLFYGLLAMLSLVNFVMNILCAKWFKPQKAKKLVNDMVDIEINASVSK